MSDRLGFAACGLLTLLGMGGTWGRAAADTVGAAAPGAAGGTANSAGRAHAESTGEAAAPVNDAAYGGRAVDLLPATPTRVWLKSTTIQIHDLPRDAAWEIVATYELHNDTAEAVALSLLFPEDKCAAGAGCTESAGAFRAPATQLDGKPVASRVTTPASTPWARHADRVFQYDLRLQPGQRSRLVHQYRLDRSAGNDWTELRYVSSAGRWGEPIDAVDFKVRLVQPVLYVMHTPTYDLSRFAEAPAGAGRASVVEIALGARSLATFRNRGSALASAATSPPSATSNAPPPRPSPPSAPNPSLLHCVPDRKPPLLTFSAGLLRPRQRAPFVAGPNGGMSLGARSRLGPAGVTNRSPQLVSPACGRILQSKDIPGLCRYQHDASEGGHAPNAQQGDASPIIGLDERNPDCQREDAKAADAACGDRVGRRKGPYLQLGNSLREQLRALQDPTVGIPNDNGKSSAGRRHAAGR